MQALGVDIKDVLDALKERNIDTSGGRLRGLPAEPLTRAIGRFQDAREIRDISFEISGTDPPQRVYLRDFAQAIDGTEEQRVLVSLNGEPAVKVSVQKQPDANTVTVVDAVKERIKFLQRSGLITDDTVLTTTLDESRFIRNAINNVVLAGLTGSVLAVIAVLLFLGSPRQTFIIVLAIPLATLTAVILMGVFGLSLNVFSLGGLALGVGIVVDNSIVMLENIVKGHEKWRMAFPGVARERGKMEKPAQAGFVPVAPPLRVGVREQIIMQAQKSSKELESALLASTSTNLVAVLPFLLIGGLISLIFNELILTISFAMAASLIIGLTVVPMLASRLLGVTWSSGVGKLWLLREFNRRFTAATTNYGRLLKVVLKWRLVAIALAFVVLGGGSWWIGDRLSQEILPRISTGQARLFAQFPPGTNLETNRKVMAAVDEILLEQPETEYVFSTIGGFLFSNISKLSDLKPISREYFNFKTGNPIRLANKILSRFRLSLMVSLLDNTGVISTSTAPVDLIFAPLIKDLQAQTSAPLRLPIRVIEHAGRSPLYSRIEFVEPTGYGIRMAYTPHCLVASACTYGVFFVELASESQESLEGEVIPLAQNIAGYFADYTCKARCSDARLIWDRDGYRYYLGIKAGKLETLVKLANSAIENPALDLFPDTSRLSDCF